MFRGHVRPTRCCSVLLIDTSFAAPWQCCGAFPFCAISNVLQSLFPRLGFSVDSVPFPRWLFASVWGATSSSPGVSLCFSWPQSSVSRRTAHGLTWTPVCSLQAGRAGPAPFPALSTFTSVFSEVRGLSLLHTGLCWTCYIKMSTWPLKTRACPPAT